MISIFRYHDMNTIIGSAYLLFMIKHHIVLFCPVEKFLSLPVPQAQGAVSASRASPTSLWQGPPREIDDSVADRHQGEEVSHGG